MPTPIHLTTKYVAQAALQAYDKGLLAFQNRDKLDPSLSTCRYVYDEAPGVVCLIGAALPPDSAAATLGTVRGLNLSQLVKHGLVTTPNDATAYVLDELQGEHDYMVEDPDDEVIDELISRLRMLANA